MKTLPCLLLLPLLVGCASEKDPYALSPDDAKAAASRVRPPIPKGGLPAPGKGGPVQIKLKGPMGKDAPGNLPPGAVPLGNGDNLLPPPEKTSGKN